MFTDIKRLFRHTSIYGLGDIAGRSISFLLIPLYTHYLQETEYGIMALAYVFIGFVNVLYIMGLNTAFIRFFTAEKESEERKTIFSTTIIFLVCTSFLASFCLWFASSPVASLLFRDATYASYIRMMACILFIDTVAQFPLLILRALEKSKHYAMITIIRFVVTVTLNLYFVLYLDKRVEGVLISNLLTSLIILLILLPIALGYLKRSFSFALMKKMLDFGLPLIPAVLCVLTIDLSDRYILEYYKGLDKVGVYSLGYRLGMIMTLFVSAFRIAWPPFLLSVAEQENAKEIYAKVMTYFLLAALTLFLGVTLYLNIFLRLFVGKEYWEAEPIVPIVLLSYLFYGVYINFIAGIYITKKTKPIPYITGLAAIVNIVFNLLLIPEFGMRGAAVATLLAYISMAMALFTISKRMYFIQYEKIRILKIVAAAAIIFAANKFLSHSRMGVEFTRMDVEFALKSLLMVGFFILIIGFRFFKADEISTIRKKLHKGNKGTV